MFIDSEKTLNRSYSVLRLNHWPRSHLFPKKYEIRNIKYETDESIRGSFPIDQDYLRLCSFTCVINGR